MSDIYEAAFAIGIVICHQRFGYRGVIVDVDAVFSGSDQWYEQVARSRPPKDRPWYHVLVDQSNTTTYVAEQNLEEEPSPQPVLHPLVEQYFNRFEEGCYQTDFC